MDQKTLEEGGQNALNFKCTKILHGVDKPIACQTPEKTSEPLPTKSKDGPIQLPEKYRALADLFEHMSCSLRLLHLRKKSPTFQNICTQVEVLAKRKFSYEHLAQIKCILPEAIHIDKVLVHDHKTLCMKPDLKIILILEAVQGHSSESAYVVLRQLFCSRLNNFFNTHPEGTDIPEATLPEPFQPRPHNFICEDLPVYPTATLSSTTNQIQLLSQKCHLYPSFDRHFSKKNVVVNTEKTQCFLSNQTALSCHSSGCLDNEGSESESKWLKKCTASCLKSDIMTNQDMERGQQKESCSMCFQPNVNTPARLICSPHSASCSSYESPDVKIASSTDILMTETPVQSAPRRLVPCSDVELQIMTTQNSIFSCNKPAKRVLDFSHMEGDNDALDISADALESSRDVHGNIPEASRGCAGSFDASSSVVLPHEGEENLGCSHENTNQTKGGSATWKQMSLSSPGLVDVIYSIFCFVKFSPITKEELLHKIIMNSLDFVEIREVEERIEFIEKVVPDWIWKKLVPSGDIMYCIKKVSDLESVRSRLSSNITVGVK